MEKRIGVLQFAAGLDEAAAGFREGLASYGLSEGHGVAYEHRNAEGDPGKVPLALQSLLSHGAHLIYACGTPAAKCAAQSAGRPVVFTPVFDPVAAGLVNTLERPGRPVTGVCGLVPATEKLSVLKAVFPNLTKLTFLYNPGDPNAPSEVRQFRAAAGTAGVALVEAPVADAATLDAQLVGVMQEAELVFLSLDKLTSDHLASIAAASRAFGKPLVAHNTPGVRAGALLAIEADLRDMGRQAAELAYRIFNGADPAVVPVALPRQARLVWNADAAAILGAHLPAGIAPDAVVRDAPPA